MMVRNQFELSESNRVLEMRRMLYRNQHVSNMPYDSVGLANELPKNSNDAIFIMFFSILDHQVS